jgi:hypothetical protein
MAKKKPAPKKPAKKPTKKPAAKAKAKPAPRPAPATPPADESAKLAEMGFFRGAYNWEADRTVPALGGRVRLLVDHTGGVVAPVQVRALELLLESEADLRAMALKVSYECMLRWADDLRKRHPELRGKPIGERAFTRGCELDTVFLPSPKSGGEEPVPVAVVNVAWGEDGGHPYEVTFDHQRGGWAVAACRRT